MANDASCCGSQIITMHSAPSLPTALLPQLELEPDRQAKYAIVEFTANPCAPSNTSSALAESFAHPARHHPISL